MRSRSLVSLAAAAWLAWGAAPALAQEPVSLRVAYVQAADHPHGLGIQKFAELVQQKSANRIGVKAYGNATLGLPFLFGNYAEADAVLDGPIGKRLLDLLPDKGLIGLGYWDHGFRVVSNSRRPIARLEDFAGLKLRVPQSTIFIDTFTALGANAVPMPIPELYGALEAKAMDGQENPYAAVEALKLQEVQKFASATNHAYNPLVVVFSKMKWDKPTAADRQILMDAAAEAGAYERKVSREANEKAAESLKGKGMQVNAVAPAEVARMREKVSAVNAKYVKDGGEKLAAEMMAEIEKVRAKR